MLLVVSSTVLWAPMERLTERSGRQQCRERTGKASRELKYELSIALEMTLAEIVLHASGVVIRGSGAEARGARPCKTCETHCMRRIAARTSLALINGPKMKLTVAPSCGRTILSDEVAAIADRRRSVSSASLMLGSERYSTAAPNSTKMKDAGFGGKAGVWDGANWGNNAKGQQSGGRLYGQNDDQALPVPFESKKVRRNVRPKSTAPSFKPCRESVWYGTARTRDLEDCRSIWSGRSRLSGS